MKKTLALFAVVGMLSLYSCGNEKKDKDVEDHMEEAGDAIEDTMEDAGDAIDDASEDVKEKVDETTDKID
ncbi:hypothetical protein GCM10028791_24600 [Echinicola sediminis]